MSLFSLASYSYDVLGLVRYNGIHNINSHYAFTKFIRKLHSLVECISIAVTCLRSGHCGSENWKSDGAIYKD